MIESKVVMNEEVEQDKYPKLMVARDGTVVLFTECKIGTCVYGEYNDVGEYAVDWVMGQFHPFHGTVTLTNK